MVVGRGSLNFVIPPADAPVVKDEARRRDAPPINPLGLFNRMAIRFRHRRISDRTQWTLRVRFDEIIESNLWELPANIDELNDRYVEYSELYSDGHMPRRRRNS